MPKPFMQIQLIGDKKAARKLEKMGSSINHLMRRTMERGTIDLQSEVRRQLSLGGSGRVKGLRQPKNPGSHLRVVSGTLRDSIRREIKDEGLDMQGLVGPGTEAKDYAPVHEFGSRDGRIPKRPYQKPAFEKLEPAILSSFLKTLNKIIEIGRR